MVMGTAFALCLFLFSLCVRVHRSSSSSHVTLGIHPLDERYYLEDFIKCKDRSKSFSRDRLNDNFCDCSDGTDEPGTSACPAGKFYCRNAGSTPRFLFSSRVNDGICDLRARCLLCEPPNSTFSCIACYPAPISMPNRCSQSLNECHNKSHDLSVTIHGNCCDGSDEYDGTVICPNTCVMGGNIIYETRNYESIVSSRKSKHGIKTEDTTHKLIGLKAVVLFQLGFVVFVVTFRLFCKRKARRTR